MCRQRIHLLVVEKDSTYSRLQASQADVTRLEDENGTLRVRLRPLASIETCQKSVIMFKCAAESTERFMRR